MAAGSADFSGRLSTITPIAIAVVLALAFLLLVGAFGSPALAAAVIGLNLLSVGASFGILVEVFQHGVGQNLLGFTSDGAIVEWLPLFAFVLLFGLSMDYTVLILERVREERNRGADARTASVRALGATAGTVTSAAAVMIGGVQHLRHPGAAGVQAARLRPRRGDPARRDDRPRGGAPGRDHPARPAWSAASRDVRRAG